MNLIAFYSVLTLMVAGTLYLICKFENNEKEEKGSIRMTDVSYLASEGRNMDYHLDIHHKKEKRK